MIHVESHADRSIYARKMFVAVLAYQGFIGICSGTSEPEENRIGLYRHHTLSRRVSKLPCLVFEHSIAAVEPTLKFTNQLSCNTYYDDLRHKRERVASIEPV